MTLDPTKVLDLANSYHIMFKLESPHKDVFVWRGRFCDCEKECIISSGFGYMPKEPWAKFSVLIPSALRPGEMVTYHYSNDPGEVMRLVDKHLREEHRKGCMVMTRKGNPRFLTRETVPWNEDTPTEPGIIPKV